MRQLSRIVLVFGALLAAAPTLHAQMSVNISAGASLPMGDQADFFKMGYNAAVGVGFKPLLVPVGLRVEGLFNSFEVDAPAPADGSLRVMALTANATYTLIPQLYAIGGVGMYNSKASGIDESESDFGFNIGAGINIPLTGFGTYLEARYHHVPGDNDNSFKFVPISFGIKF